MIGGGIQLTGCLAGHASTLPKHRRSRTRAAEGLVKYEEWRSNWKPSHQTSLADSHYLCRNHPVMPSAWFSLCVYLKDLRIEREL